MYALFTRVKERMPSLRISLIRVYLSQTDRIDGMQNLNRLGDGLENGNFASYFFF